MGLAQRFNVDNRTYVHLTYAADYLGYKKDTKLRSSFAGASHFA